MTISRPKRLKVQNSNRITLFRIKKLRKTNISENFLSGKFSAISGCQWDANSGCQFLATNFHKIALNLNAQNICNSCLRVPSRIRQIVPTGPNLVLYSNRKLCCRSFLQLRKCFHNFPINEY